MCCEEPLAFASLVGMAPLASLHVQAKGLCWTAWPGEAHVGAHVGALEDADDRRREVAPREGPEVPFLPCGLPQRNVSHLRPAQGAPATEQSLS